jgi:hypothetical protein
MTPVPTAEVRATPKSQTASFVTNSLTFSCLTSCMIISHVMYDLLPNACTFDVKALQSPIKLGNSVTRASWLHRFVLSQMCHDKRFLHLLIGVRLA